MLPRLRALLARLRNAVRPAWTFLFRGSRPSILQRVDVVKRQDHLAKAALLAPTLPQNDTLLERLERQLQLDVSRAVYVYDLSKSSGLDIPMATITAALSQTVEHPDWLVGWATNAAKSFANVDLWKVQTSGQAELTTFADYTQVFAIFPTPSIVNTWQDDRIFAAQRLAGLNPVAIQLVTRDGESRGINWTPLSVKLSPQIKNARFGGRTVLEMFQAGRLYVTDFDSLQGLVPLGNYQLAPLALFVRRDDDPGLLPVAIQLTQDPNDPSSYLAPPSPVPPPDFTWLMAKTFMQCADVNRNQVWHHLGNTHFIELSFALSMHRQLALQHPLHRLLAKHFAGLIETIEVGLVTLLPPGRYLDQIFDVQAAGGVKMINNAYAQWTFEDWGLPGDLERRGTGDPTTLPYYPYRDDGLVIWARLRSYLEDYVALYYADDEAVVKDYELARWAQEVSSMGGANAKGVTRFPRRITTRPQLRDILLRIIWTAGPQHAAMNFPLVDFATFVPNSPGAMVNPLHGEVTERDVVDLLPNKNRVDRNQVGTQVTVYYSLANFYYDKLLDYHLSESDGAEAIVRKHHHLLITEDRAKIVANNGRWAGRPGLLDYPYFLPENIPNSTST